MVLIADGSSMVARHPTHHRCVTKALRRRGLATARVDLLTESEQTHLDRSSTRGTLQRHTRLLSRSTSTGGYRP